jgi:ADP-heptose:LPS heptosyltransferase
MGQKEISYRGLVRILEKRLRKEPLRRQRLAKKRTKKILIITSHLTLSELLLATPAIKAVRRHYPQSVLDVVVPVQFWGLFEICDYANECLPGYTSFSRLQVRAMKTFMSRVRKNYDLAIVLNTPTSHSLVSDIVAHMSGAPFILGTKENVLVGAETNFLYNLHAPMRQEGSPNRTMLNLDIVKHIYVESDDHREEITLSQADADFAASFFSAHRIDRNEFILFVHLSPDFEHDRWPVQHFINTVNRLAREYNARVISTWDEADANAGREFQGSLPFLPIDVNELTLRQRAAILQQSDLVLTPYSYVVHLASSVKAPTVSIFGATDPEEWKPVCERCAVLRGEDGTTADITVDDVAGEARGLVKSFQKRFSEMDISDQALQNYIDTLSL